MEGDSRNVNTGSTFSYGAGPSWIDRLEQIMIPQHSSLQSQTRMATEGANPLDLTSAIAHELLRSNSTPQPGWQYAWSHESSSPQEPASGLLQEVLPFGAFLSNNASSRGVFPQYTPRVEEAVVASPHQQQIGATRLQPDYSTESESLASAHRRFVSMSNGFPSARVDSAMRGGGCPPWIERMMQADVTPTPCPSLGISTSLSLAQRAAGDVSCVASATVDLQSCHSSDMQQWSENQSMRSTFSCDLVQRESTVEISADLCTDDEDPGETRPIDEKRKKRMLSNRASAQRSRQRRQERLDQLEVLTAQLRVENSTLQKKLSAALQIAKKFEDQNTNLVKKMEKLSKELHAGKPKKVMAAAAADECASSHQATCASSCEMNGDRTSMDPTLVRDGNGASTPSGSPGWPSGSRPNGNNNRAESSPTRRSSGKKRSFGESETADQGGSHSTSIGNQRDSPGYLASSQPSRPRPSATGNNIIGGETNSFPEPSAFANSFGLDPTLEADRWLEFSECFK